MKFTKKDVVVMALARLGGDITTVHTEDVAIAAHAIDPVAFGWKKYPQRTDLDVARTTLRHEGEGRAPRVEGSIQQGWHLTPAGVVWARQFELGNEVGVVVASTSAAAQGRRAETREVGTAISRVRGSAAFRLWRGGEDFSPRQAAEVFRIDEYTPAKERSRKAANLQALTVSDKEIGRFLSVAIPAAEALRAPIGRKETT